MSMCWGLNMKPNRKYTQTILKSFHISGATIDEGEYAKLYLTADQTKYVIAHLDNKACRQVALDLNFCIGDKIMFQTSGDATISLIGYMHDGGESDDDEDYEDEEYEAVAKAIQKQAGGKAAAKGSKAQEESDEDDDEEVDDNKLVAEYSSFLEDEESGEEEEGEEDDEDDEEEEDEEDDSEAEAVAPQPKKAKLNENDKKAAKGQNGVAKKEVSKPQEQQQQQKSKKDKKAAAVPEAKKEQPKGKEAKAQSPNVERSLAGGVKVQDVVTGSGAEAKQGKRVSVYYIGRLKSNNKSFDSMQKGNGFKFALGTGEVIKGWDVGVVGMKVGGKRRITCPPHMAYGARGHPPTIPPNATLLFDVELKAVH